MNIFSSIIIFTFCILLNIQNYQFSTHNRYEVSFLLVQLNTNTPTFDSINCLSKNTIHSILKELQSKVDTIDGKLQLIRKTRIDGTNNYRLSKGLRNKITEFQIKELNRKLNQRYQELLCEKSTVLKEIIALRKQLTAIETG